jgi:DNA primase
MSNLDPFFSEVYSRLDIESLLPELEPKDKGSYHLVRCPSCQKLEAYIYKGRSGLRCNRENNCSYRSTLWVITLERNRGDKKKTLEDFSRASNVPLPPREEHWEEHLSKKLLHLNLLEEFHSLLIRELWKEGSGSNALKYLTAGRHYSLEEIESMELGLFPSLRVITQTLQEKGFSAEEIDSLGFFPAFEGRLAIPYRGSTSELKSFIGRTISSEEPKYLYPKGASRSELMGLYRAKSEPELVIVEGVLDPLIAHLKGFPQVVGMGSNSIGGEQFKLLAALKKPIFLLLDNDKAGSEGTERAVRQALEKGLEVFICRLPQNVPAKDLDELLRLDDGPQSFREILDQAKRKGSGARYLAQRVCQSHDLTSDLDKRKAISSSLKASTLLQTAIDRDCFFDEVSKITLLPRNQLLGEAQAYRDHLTREKLAKEARRLPEDISKALDAGEVPEALEALGSRVQAIRSDYLNLSARGPRSLTQILKEKLERDSNRDPNKLLGYELRNLRTFAQKIDGVQPGLIVVAASTNVGKTALVSTLALDLLASNPEVRILYFSLDDAKNVIINRLLGGLSALSLNQIQRGTRQSRSEDRAKIQASYEKLGAYSEKNRLNILDLADVRDASAITTLVQDFGTENHLVICIDGLHNLEVKNGPIREVNIERANKVKALADRFEIPVIVTAELNKIAEGNEPTLADISETGKFAYNANAVILLWSDEQEKGKEIPLNAKLAKNKLSDFKGKLELTFFRDQGRIIERESFVSLAENF